MRRTAFVATALASAACATVKFVSDYDETTDREVTALQRMVDDSLTRIGKQKAPACLYAAHTDFYAAAHSALHSLIIRNRARGADNRLTSDQLVLMDSSEITTLEKLHQLASSKTPPACMNADALALDQQALDQSFEAILKLELAKKRGS
jgi:hypothetical protein